MSLHIKDRLNTLEATQSELLDLKADKAFTYSKVAVDAKIDNLVYDATAELNTLKESWRKHEAVTQTSRPLS